jgi:phosphoserine phosphatase RsbU/P
MFTVDDTNGMPAAPVTRALMCSEVWGANSNVAHSVELPGLLAWVYSAPIELGQDGGDIHYLSACDRGVLSRIALADVSGHGRAVSAVAERLLDLMRAHINTVAQPAFLRELSGSLQDFNVAERSIFATAVLIGFDSSTGLLVSTNAGHPPPLWFHAGERRWDWLREATPQAATARNEGVPLGLSLSPSYRDTEVTLCPGDLLICYTDGLSEAMDDTGRELGIDGLLELAHGLPVESPMAAGATLLGHVDAFRRGQPAHDDETLIVLQRPACD